MEDMEQQQYKEKFKKIIAAVQEAKDIPEYIKKRVKIINDRILGEMTCSTIHKSRDTVDYKSALETLMKLKLIGPYRELLESI